jgi:hypothetical protein
LSASTNPVRSISRAEARNWESIPDAVMDEVLAKVAVIFE